MKRLLSIVAVAASLNVFGQDVEKYGMENKDLPKGLEIGAQAPELTLMTSEGKEFSLSEALEKGSVVVYFYRGNWCPYCTKQLANLSDSINLITETGATVVAISPESPTQLEKSASTMEGEILLLSDKDGEAMKSFDVDFYVTMAYQDKLAKGKEIDLAEFNEQDAAVLPVPATFVINQDGKIVYRYFDINYKQRATVAAVLKALK